MRQHRVLLSIVAAAAAFPAPGHAQKQFEGHLTLTMNGDKGKPQPAEAWIKGRKMRMELGAEGQTFAMISDYEASRMTMIMPKMKMYMTQALPKIDSLAQEASSVTRTGRKDRVAGHRCEIVQITDKAGKRSEVCGATDMGSFAMGGGPGARGKLPAWAAGMKAFFPLRVTDDTGAVVLDVTRIDAQRVSDDLFAPPVGYRTMSVPGR